MSTEKQSSNEILQGNGKIGASSQDIQRVKNAQEEGRKITKIHDILGPFEFSKAEDAHYRESLEKFNQEQLSIVQKLDKVEFQKLLSKPFSDILQSLIKTQISDLKSKGIKNWSGIEKKKFRELIAQSKGIKDNKQEKQEVVIATKQSETKKLANKEKNEEKETNDNSDLIDAIGKTNSQIAGLRGALLENAALKKNAKIGSLRKMIVEAESKSKNREGLTTTQLKDLQKEMEGKFKSIIAFLQKPGNLESIAKELDGTDSKEYIELKAQLVFIEPNLRLTFDRVEAGFADELAKVKLGTDNLDGVNTDDDVLVKTEGGFTIEAGKTDRTLSFEGSDYKLPSKLDSKYEDQIEDLHQQSNKELTPYNTELTTLSGVLNLIKTLETNGVRFDDAKTRIQQKHPETYNSLGLSGKTSYNDMTNVIQAHISQLEDSKKKVIKKIKQKLKRITAQSTKEAQEKDRKVNRHP